MDPASSPLPVGLASADPVLLAAPLADARSLGAVLPLADLPLANFPLAELVLAQGLAMGPFDLALRVGVLLVLLALSALFSGSEVALFSYPAAEREGLADDPARAAQRVAWLLERPRVFLVAVLILNTVVNVAAAILSAQLTLLAASAYGWSETALLAVQVVALTFVLLVVSEIAPKLVASRQPVAFARAVSAPIYALTRLLYPVASRLARATERLQQRLKPAVQSISNEDIKTMADVGEAHGTLGEDERALIHSIVEFGETTVREVMVSRVDMVALPASASLEEALTLIRSSGHSRLPLFGEHLDEILGVVYAKDLLPYLGPDAPATVDWAALARKPRFVPLSKTLDDMLGDFQQHHTHIAIVVDEYGGTAGLLTLEDLLEEVVGDIRDELDSPEDDALVHPVGPASWRADARIDLDDLAEALDLALDTEQFDFETLGGLIFHLRGDVPRPGDEVTFERLHLRVEALDNNRIRQVLVTLVPEPVEGEEAADA